MSIHKTILNHNDIENKIQRIAYQVYEATVSEQEIIIIGIKENGYLLAKKLVKSVAKISDKKTTLGAITLNKKNCINTVKIDLEEAVYQNKSIIVVDDVLHTGSTLTYAVMEVLKTNVKQIKTVVLVDRNHKKFPIKADFKGISLSTSMNENVVVIFEKNKDRAILE